MMRYLQHDTIQKKGLAHFDCWASTFGETTTAIELAPEGTGYRARTRFSKFFNLPELMNLFKEAADIKTSDQLNLPTPTAVYHNVVAQPTEIQKSMVQELSERAAAVHSGAVDASVDNMLKITSDGRKLGLDQRIINPDLPDEPQSKVNMCVDNIYKIWEDGKSDKLTQLVFCDLSTPKNVQTSRKAAKAPGGNIDSPEIHAIEQFNEPEETKEFTVYDDIRDKLVSRGIPREEIAFIHEANTEVRKKELYAKVRSGQVRVLMGSTFKMGAGMNVQDRLVALHDLDCPWRPGDLEQRSGRIIRQGNKNEEVHIYRYVTEATFDAYLWQTIENKQKFISQIMTSKSPVRSCEDIDETALSYAEIKALCAGDDRIKEKMDLDIDVARLKLMKANHQSQQFRLEDNLLKHFPEQIEQNKGYIEGFKEDMKTLEQHPHPQDGFAGMTVRNDYLTDKENAGAALVDAFKEVKGLDLVEIGSYRGFNMYLSLEDFGKEYVLTLKGKMTHRVTLGKDPRGNLVRIENAFNNIEKRLETVKERLDALYVQVENAKAELGKPFPQEEELKVKSARLAELNAELNIDDRTPMEQAVDEASAERDEVPQIAKSEKPSLLAKLQRPLPHNKAAETKHNKLEGRYMKDIPIYDKTVSYAIEHNELEAYRASYKMNMACKAAISDAINSAYTDNSLNSQNALKELTETFSLERIAVITAVSIREQDHDGRISVQNKEWAKSVPFPKDIDDWGRDRNAAFRISAVHPGLLDLFANTVRKEIDLSKNFSLKKPSLVEKLSRPLPQKTDTAVKSKDKEL